MKSSKLLKNRVVLAIGAGVVATSAVAVSAAGLGTLSASGVGTSTAAVSGCQDASLTVTWPTPAYSADGGAGGVPTYTVSSVDLGGIIGTCQGKPYKLTVAKADGTSIQEKAGTTTDESATTTVTLNAAADSAQIGTVTLTIYNT